MAKTFKSRILFDYLGNILTKKSKDIYYQHIQSEEFDTEFKKFLIIRYLSMSPDKSVRKIILENQFTFEKMDNRILYKYLITVIPKQYSSFITFIK